MPAINLSKRTLIYMLLGLFTIIAGLLLLLKDRGTAEELEIFNKISPFELEEVLTESNYTSDNGKLKLLSFIFINCPDGVCPLSMQDYTALQEQLKEDGLFGTDVELLAVTFDPERDTTEALSEYAGYFSADPQGWRFLRGKEEDIQKLADELKFFYLLSEDGSGMHATTMYIIDEQHQVRAFHKMSSSAEAMNREAILADLYQLVDEKQRKGDNK